MPPDHDTDEIRALFDNNRRWAAQIERDDPGFFARLAVQQEPRYLWVGCSDSRVPANQITGLVPGEVFVHRNIGNVVHHTDLNCMSVLEFAVRALQVRHVIVCGHYGCSGVRAVMGETVGVIDHWLSGVRDLWEQHRSQLDQLGPEAAHARLCELNVRHQVRSLCRTSAVKQAWQRGQPLEVHGWIYGVQDGLLRDLGDRIASPVDLERNGG